MSLFFFGLGLWGSFFFFGGGGLGVFFALERGKRLSTLR